MNFQIFSVNLLKRYSRRPITPHESGLKNLKQTRYITKYILKLVKNYDSVPNLKDRDDLLNIHFLGSVYTEGELSKAGFYERMKIICGKNEKLQSVLLNFLHHKGHFVDEKYWQDRFSSNNVQYIQEEIRSSPNELKLSQEVIFVSSNKSMKQLYNSDLSKVKMVGLDFEQKSSVGIPNGLSLIQIATSSFVYIIDAKNIPANSNSWNYLKKRVFKNPNLLKLGFGLDCDAATIFNFPPLSEVELSGKGFIDLYKLWTTLAKDFNVKFPFEGGTGKNLKTLVMLCLGKELVKRETLSDWDRRPLRKAQLKYAALDAACLLETFERLVSICWSQGIKIEDYCPSIRLLP